HRLMVRRWLFWILPNGIYRDFKVLERAAPGFHGVRSHSSIPVELVNGEVVMFNRRQHPRQAHVLHVGDRSELHAVETHRYSSGYFPAESPGIKIWNFK